MKGKNALYKNTPRLVLFRFTFRIFGITVNVYNIISEPKKKERTTRKKAVKNGS